MSLRIGVDLGGTKIEAIVLDAQGKELARKRIPTPQNDYSATLTAIEELVLALERTTGGCASVGMGTPGAISAVTGKIKNANSVCLIDQDLRGDLQRRLSRPIRIANDADCFALSEASDGAAQGAYSVFGVILGTGVGGGIVIDRNLVRGKNAIAGEWGHNPLPWPTSEELSGPACYCGKHGCIETYLSGPGFENDYRRRGGPDNDARTIIRGASQGDAIALACWQIYVDRLARSLATVINIVDPECVVLGGGMSNITSLYREVTVRLPRYVFSDTVTTKLVAAKHGDSSGVRGAAWLWP